MNKQKIAEDIYQRFDCLAAVKAMRFKDDEFKGIFVILRLLRKQNRAMIAGEIATLLQVSTARIAVALKTLESKKYIIKSKMKEDARKTIVDITNDGLLALKEREKNIVHMIESHLNKLTEEETLQFQHIIVKLLS